MKIFLGSSSKRLDELRKVSEWVTKAGHEAWPWNKPGLFPVGHFTFDTLNDLKDQVDASIFIFGDDDKVWYRSDSKLIPRDNVLIEYGLFAGVLEPSRVAICKSGGIHMPTDVLGVTYVDLEKPRRAKVELDHWFKKIDGTSPSLGRARLMTFQNKFSMPATNQFWRRLAEDAVNRFVLLGGSNKSWIHHSKERRRSLGQAILRIIEGGGDVALLCYDEKSVVDAHAVFIRECIVNELGAFPKGRRTATLTKLRMHLRVAATNDLKYQAVISDRKIVVMPLLNSRDFKEESLVFELWTSRHGEHFTSYQNDILRTIERFELPKFVRTRCAP